MDSQHGALQLSILDLPEDILREILDCFEGKGLYNYRGGIQCYYRTDPGDENFRTVQAVRLVCRALCMRASPLLAPVIRLRISPESLYRVDQLTKNPQIAAGVRLIQVSLAYRPREIAENASRYRDLQQQTLGELHGRCDHYVGLIHQTPDYEIPNYQVPDDQISEGEFDDYEPEISRAMGMYMDMISAWRDWRFVGYEGRKHDPTDEERDKFKDLLSQCYMEYRQKSQDQERLLTGGSFAARLAASINRIPSLRALAFLDEPDISPEDFRWGSDLPILANDPEKLRQLMISPHSWRALDDLDPIPEILPAKLLWQLPIAIHAAGKQLHGLAISPLPIRSNFDKLCPRYDESGSADWKSLKTALQSTRIVDVSAGNYGVIRREHISTANQGYLHNYLCALLSSPCLEEIRFNFYGLNINPGWSEKETPEKFNAVGPAFATARYENLKRLMVSDARFTEEELVSFFGGMGSNRLEWIFITSIGVAKGGGWARPLDVLREKVMLSPKRCTVSFSRLRGGGFDKAGRGRELGGEGESQDSDDDHDFGVLSKFEDGVFKYEKERLCRAARRYLCGKEKINPVAALETQSATQ